MSAVITLAADRGLEQPIDPDWELLARVAQGDSYAFTALVERYQERLLRLTERLLGDVEEARDAAQDVFLKVYRKAGTLTPQGRLYTLLYRIAVNHCSNKLRRRRVVQFFRFEAASADGEPAFDPADPAPDPAAVLDSRRRWLATRAAVDRLPTNQRLVLLLARFEGLSYKEIAEVLGISLGAVESRLVRAMRNLEAAQEEAPPRVSERKVPS